MIQIVSNSNNKLMQEISYLKLLILMHSRVVIIITEHLPLPLARVNLGSNDGPRPTCIFIGN